MIDELAVKHKDEGEESHSARERTLVVKPNDEGEETSTFKRAATRSIRSSLDDIHAARISNFKAGEITWVQSDHTDPSDAMKELLKHVRMDPDGGIENLASDTAQASKLAALEKEGIELCVAVVGVFRAIFNVYYVGWHACHNIYGFICRPEYRHRLAELQEDLNLELLSLSSIIFIVSVFEGTVLAWLIITSVSHLVKIPFNRELHGVQSRYVFIAKFYWTDLRLMQTMSGLRLLSYIHPNLISKNKKEFEQFHQEAARRVLARFLKKQVDTLTDEELIERVIPVLVQRGKEYNAASEESESDVRSLSLQNNLIADYLSFTPYDMISKLFDDVDPGSLANNAEYDTSVFSLHMRLKAIAMGETLGFGIVCFLAFLMGSAAFFVKICTTAHILMDPNVGTWWYFGSILFFMNQIMSLTAINQLLLWRVQAFILGGKDAVVSMEEYYIVQTYLSLLADRVWNHPKLPFYQKLAIMLQLDDDDLQQLVIEEDPHLKSPIVLSVKRFMREQNQLPQQTKLLDLIF